MEDHEVAFYQGLTRQHRGTSRQVGAWSEQSQTARLDVMFDVLDSLLGEGLAGLSILDFGCGKGDLAAYLDRHGRLDSLRYIGIDGIEENVEDARRLGGYDFRLVRWNGLGRVVDEPVDVIVFSGTFATTRIDRRLAMYGSLSSFRTRTAAPHADQNGPMCRVRPAPARRTRGRRPGRGARRRRVGARLRNLAPGRARR